MAKDISFAKFFNTPKSSATNWERSLNNIDFKGKNEDKTVWKSGKKLGRKWSGGAEGTYKTAIHGTLEEIAKQKGI